MNQPPHRRNFPFKKDLLVALLIFSAALTAFLLSPNYGFSDSQYTFVVSESLLKHHSFALDHFALPHLEPKDNGNYVRNGHIYQQEWSNGRLYYYHPPGSSVLSVPYVAVMDLFGFSCINPDGTYNPGNEMELQGMLAGLLMALTIVVFYFTARLVLPFSWSALIALGAAWATPVWSTLSRGMWSDTWGVFLLSIVILLLVANIIGRAKLNPIVLATVLAWTYFARPTNSIAIAVVTIYIVLCHRQWFLAYAATGLLWFTGFLIYSRTHFSHWLPNYYRASRLSFEHFGEALLGHLISPARGLLVYVPVLLFTGYLLVVYRRTIAYRGLLWVGLVICLLYWLANSSFPHWWGGNSYGPRLMAGVVPWIVLLTILGIEAMRRARVPKDAVWRIQNAAGVVLLLVSIAMNGMGAVVGETQAWNEHPASVDKQPSRLWDWRYPQFLAGFLRPPLPAEFPSADVRVEFSRTTAEPYLWYGWSVNEPEFRWTSAGEAAIVFGLDEISDAELLMKASPLIVVNKLDQQRVNIRLNNQPLTTLTLTQPIAQEFSVPLPKQMLRTKNSLIFELPDARTPQSLGLNRDPRKLALAVFWMEVRTPHGPKKIGDKTVARGALPIGGYSAGIEPLDAPSRSASGQTLKLRVRVTNISGITWPAEGEADGSFKLHLGNHWRDAAGKMLQLDDGRAALPFDIAPGGSAELVLTITTPQSPGDYVLELDMVQERVNWFVDENSRSVRIKINVF